MGNVEEKKRKSVSPSWAEEGVASEGSVEGEVIHEVVGEKGGWEVCEKPVVGEA